MLRYFPKAFEIETTRSRPIRPKPEPVHHSDDYYVGDNYDRNDSGEPSKNPKNSKGRNKLKRPYYHPHSHTECTHPDHYHHHHHKNPEDRVQTHKNTKYEENEDYYDEKKNYNKKKMSVKEEKEDDKNTKDKDYITGVLVTIPKIKGKGDADNYFKDGKHNVFFQQPLKTEDEDYYHHHHHHVPVEDELESYFY